MSGIELDDLSKRQSVYDEIADHELPTVALSDEANDGVISAWTFTTAGLRVDYISHRF
jgi:hypothetical protein